MRLLLSFALLSFSISSYVFAAPPPVPGTDKSSKEEVAVPKTDEAPKNDEPQSTTFNGQEVPPLKALNGTTLDEDISTGYWYALRLIQLQANAN